MNPLITKREQTAAHPALTKLLGILMVAIGMIMTVAIVFPFVGTIIAIMGAGMIFAGIGVYSFGSKPRRDV